MYKLYSAAQSPYAWRVWIALRAKGIACEDVGLPDPDAPDHGLKTPAFRAINPMGKIPVLLTPDGQVIVESEAILDYLEHVHPTPSLQPADPLARARMKMAIRVCEGYVSAPMQHMFAHIAPTPENEAVIAREGANLRAGLEHLARFVADDRYATGGALSLADCVIHPTLRLCNVVGNRLGETDLVGLQPNLGGYVRKAVSDPYIGPADADLMAAFGAH